MRDDVEVCSGDGEDVAVEGDVPDEGMGDGLVVVEVLSHGSPGPELCETGAVCLAFVDEPVQVGIVGAGGCRGTRVNAVTPGSTATEMFLGGMEHAPAEIVARFNSFSPMNRLGRRLEIATAAAWPLSDQAGFVTGATLPVDEGFLLA